MIQKFIEKGYEIVNHTEKADIYIVNTCTVTNMSDRKSRQMLRKQKQINPYSIVVACGCYVQVAKDELEKIEEIDLVLGNVEKKDIVEIVEKYIKETKEKVVFVGDGINDSVSLVKADIGVSISSGTDIAMDSAQVVLMNDNLHKIIDLIDISSKTIKNIKENLFWAFFYNICMIPIACGILTPIGITMNPMIAAFAMTISSLTVVLNALRLKKS